MNPNVPQIYETREVQPLSANDLQSHVQIIQRVMAAVMKPGVHFGIIDGTQKPSLWRPGAEVIRLAFHADVRQDVEIMKEDGEIGYRVKSILFNPLDSSTVEAYGECWTSEEKFAWRAALCQEEFDATDATHRRIKFRKDRETGEIFTTPQVRQNPADQRNAVLKRAGTRSFREVILRGTAASDIFDQQLEEDDEEQFQGQREKPVKPVPAKAGALLEGIFKSATPINKEARKPGKITIGYGIATIDIGFWETPGDLVKESDWSKLAGKACHFSFEQKESKGRVYKNLTYLQFVIPAEQKSDDLFGGNRKAEEERTVAREEYQGTSGTMSA